MKCPVESGGDLSAFGRRECETMRGMVSYTQRSLAMTVCSDRRQGKPSPKRVPVARVEQVLGLYRDRYFDLNVRHFHEKLQHEHEIELNYTCVKLALHFCPMTLFQRIAKKKVFLASEAAHQNENDDD